MPWYRTPYTRGNRQPRGGVALRVNPEELHADKLVIDLIGGGMLNHEIVRRRRLDWLSTRPGIEVQNGEAARQYADRTTNRAIDLGAGTYVSPDEPFVLVFRVATDALTPNQYNFMIELAEKGGGDDLQLFMSSNGNYLDVTVGSTAFGSGTWNVGGGTRFHWSGGPAIGKLETYVLRWDGNGQDSSATMWKEGVEGTKTSASNLLSVDTDGKNFFGTNRNQSSTYWSGHANVMRLYENLAADDDWCAEVSRHVYAPYGVPVELMSTEHLWFFIEDTVGPTFTQALSATTTKSSTIKKGIAKTLAATSSKTASFKKGIAKTLAGTTSKSATLDADPTAANQVLMQGTATRSATIKRGIGKTLGASAVRTASFKKGISKTLTGTVTASPSIATATGRRQSLLATTTKAATLAAQWFAAPAPAAAGKLRAVWARLPRRGVS